MWRSILFSALFSMLCILLTTSRRHASERQRCAAWVECRLVRQRAFQRPRIAPTTRAAALAGRAGAIDGRKSKNPPFVHIRTVVLGPRGRSPAALGAFGAVPQILMAYRLLGRERGYSNLTYTAWVP